MKNQKIFILVSVLSIVLVGVSAFVLGKYDRLLGLDIGYRQLMQTEKHYRNISSANRWENYSQRERRNKMNNGGKMRGRSVGNNSLLDMENLVSVEMQEEIKDGLVLMKE